MILVALLLIRLSLVLFPSRVSFSLLASFPVFQRTFSRPPERSVLILYDTLQTPRPSDEHAEIPSLLEYSMTQPDEKVRVKKHIRDCTEKRCGACDASVVNHECGMCMNSRRASVFRGWTLDDADQLLSSNPQRS